MPVVDLGRQPAKGDRRRTLSGSRQVFREGHDQLGTEVADWSGRQPSSPGPDDQAPGDPDRYDARGPRRGGTVDLRGAGLVGPDRHLAARRRHQDPRRRRREPDVHRGPAAARPGPRRDLPSDDSHSAEIVRAAAHAAADTGRPVEARLAEPRPPTSPRCCSRTRCVSSSRRSRAPTPAFADRPARALQQLVRVLPLLGGRHQGPRDRQGRQRQLPHRREAPRRRGRDGLRRDLPAADPPDRRGEPQGPQQHAHPRTRRHRLALGDRVQGRRPRRDPPRPRHVRGLRRVRRPPASLGLEVALDLALQAAPTTRG